MAMLVIGLVLFLGLHSIRVFAEPLRTQLRAQHGEGRYKAVYSIVSVLGFLLIVWGYGAARLQPVLLFAPPVWSRHLASLLTLVAFILLVAAYVPRNHIKAVVHHPMVLSVKVWAFAHLLANGTLADVLLFGGFLAWALLDYRAAKARDRAAGVTYPPGSLSMTGITVVVGGVAWVVFAMWAHLLLIGVRPFGA
jgi:uncharacterized membrane protein